MRSAWHILLVAPSGYPHWRVFQEPADLLQAALIDLGYDCTIAVNRAEAGRINVVLGYHLLDPSGLETVALVPFQMEQLGLTPLDTPGARALLRRGLTVWDFSSRNVEILAANGIAATVVPLGYHPGLEIVPKREPDVDVLFSGTVTPRRAPILDSMRERGLEVGILFGAYGAEKQASLARARIHVHIHSVEDALFQQPRIAHLLNNRCFVVAEVAAENPYPKVDLVQVETSRMEEVCCYYLEHPAERVELAERCYRQFREHYPMNELLRPGIAAVEKALADPSGAVRVSVRAPKSALKPGNGDGRARKRSTAVRPATRREHPPIFIGGVGCSGTTLVADRMGMHPELSPIYETDFVVALARLLFGEQRLPVEAECIRVRDVLEDWARPLPHRPHSKGSHERYVHGPHHVLFTREHVRAASERYRERRMSGVDSIEAFAGLMDELFDAHCVVAGKPRWINKTPLYIEILPVLEELFPDLRFVHCVRDPRAVTASVLKRPWGPSSAEQAVMWWTRALEHGLRFGHRAPERYLLLRYEDLLVRPDGTLRTLFEFAGVSSEAVEVALSGPPLDPGRLNVWESELSAEQSTGSAARPGRTPARSRAPSRHCAAARAIPRTTTGRSRAPRRAGTTPASRCRPPDRSTDRR